MKNEYDKHATQYASFITSRDEWGFSPYMDLVIPALLRAAGEIQGKSILDACCGEGFLARLLAARGAHVVGVDISLNLINRAREIEKKQRHGITYITHDLARPLPQYAEHFDIVTCNMALNDITQISSLITNLVAVLKDRGKFVVSMNNPYSAVIRRKVEHYFDSGRSRAYCAFAAAGIPAQYIHRTFEEYLGEFNKNGLYLRNLSDVKPTPEHLASGSQRPKRYYRFPFFMVLNLVKLETRARPRKPSKA